MNVASRICVLAVCCAVLLPGGARAQDPVHLWSVDYGNNEFQYAYDVAVDDAGNVVAVGGFYGDLYIGCAWLERTPSTDAFVVKFDGDGGCLWGKSFGDAATRQSATHVAIDNAGNVIVAGSFEETTDFGGGELASTGGFNMFLVKLDAQGNHLWSRRYGDADELTLGEINGLAVDDSSEVVMTGSFAGTLDFGGGPLASAGGLDMFVVKLDEDGNHQWSRSFGGAAQQTPKSVDVDGDGNIVATGFFSGEVDFDGGPLTNTSASDVFVVKLDPAGSHLWSARYGNANAGDYHRARGVAVDGADNIVVAGEFEGDIDFGGGPLVSAGEYDVFLAQFAPTGAHVWSRRFGDES
ncbi:MAG: nucleotide-binding protein, partial [Candidatus Latescibacterota bacterium]